MFIKVILSVLLFAGCASSETSTNQLKPVEQKCQEGADAVYKDDGSFTCEYLKDVYLKMSEAEFKKVSLKSSAGDFVKAFYKKNPKKVKTHVIKDEMATKPVFFKVKPPYDLQLNRFENVRGFVVKYKTANFYITTYPLYYVKNFENKEVAVRCNLESYTHTTKAKDLFFKNCHIINIE